MSDTKNKTHETICIECRYQCSTRCCWAWEFVPVPEWDAIETKNGYDVYKCPNFQRGRGLPRNGFDSDGVIACLHALMAQTRDDYIKGRDLNVNENGDIIRPIKKSKYEMRKPKAERMIEAAKTRAINRKRIENWLRGNGSRLLMLQDPEAVIHQLRMFAMKYEAEQAKIRSCWNV